MKKKPTFLNLHLKTLIILSFLAFNVLPGFGADQEYEVAIVLPLSGRESQNGQIMKASLELALGNSKIQSQIIYRFYNNFSNPDSSRIISQKISQSPKTICIVGGFPSKCAKETASQCLFYQIPYLVVSSSDDSLTRIENPFIFRIAPPSTEYNDGILSWARTVGNENTKHAVLFEDHYRSRSAVADINSDLKKKWDQDYEGISFSPGKRDFQEIIAELKNENPYFLWLICSTSDCARFINQCRLIGWSPISFVFGTINPVYDQLNKLSEMSALYSFGPAVWWHTIEYPGVKEFVREYMLSEKQLPDYHAAEAYAAIEVISNALDQSENKNRIDLRKALSETDIITVFGEVKFENFNGFKNQNRVRTLNMQLLQEGWQIVWPLQFATHKYIFPPPDWREREVDSDSKKINILFPVLLLIAIGFLLYSGSQKRKELQKSLRKKE